MAANNKRARRWLTAKALGIILAGLGLTGQLRADEYPSRPITLLVPFAAGGSSDSVMRIVARKASESMKQTIIIENKPGGGGNVAALAIKHAPPDGYLLMMGHSGIKMASSGSTVVLACGVRTPRSPFGAYSTLIGPPLGAF